MPENRAATAGKADPSGPTADYEKRISLPLTPSALAAYGELTIPAPGSPFDAAGSWEQSYRIWMTGGSWDNYQGYVTLKRSVGDGETVSLDVREVLIMPRTRSIHETHVLARCLRTVLATPVSWVLESRIYDLKTKEDFPLSRVEQKGETRDGRIVVTTNAHERVHAPPGPWTWNWSLFEAVQRRPRAEDCPASFSLLDDLDILKFEQRLLPRGETAITYGGSEASVLRYDQIGRGLLPTRYYVDEEGRLLLAHTELRAYILDPEVLKTHAKKVDWISRKELK